MSGAERVVANIKSAAQEIIDNADRYVGDTKFLRSITISIKLGVNCLPDITVDKVIIPMDTIQRARLWVEEKDDV